MSINNDQQQKWYFGNILKNKITNNNRFSEASTACTEDCFGFPAVCIFFGYCNCYRYGWNEEMVGMMDGATKKKKNRMIFVVVWCCSWEHGIT
ncbi:hypothetical protein DFA_09860 [Cavenderia fasciculata]|uniref:Uncharacterized protein n=1 Tax=Cavenderia fasciculata TaxID=261658 RepID=F4QAX8_CACFS|nr:uncharacterized protein DFA_09860 [Cavenderia fasciculata]EGG15037.1 hypothetical protein DFA_09860 [Cavenderia fasciculata]|eukprot:XP_004351757.1 hypothetical protein DFA_09860 [Cavenderia fasciculata]